MKRKKTKKNKNKANDINTADKTNNLNKKYDINNAKNLNDNNTNTKKVNKNVDESELTSGKIEKKEMNVILKKLEKIQNKNIKNDYEILCDILENHLDIKLDLKYPKAIKEALAFEIKHPNFHQKEFKCGIKCINYEIDSCGMIREKLNLGKGTIEVKDGLSYIKQYVKKRYNFI